MTRRQALFSLTAKIQFQKAVNPVNTLMTPYVSPPAENLKELFEAISRIACSNLSQRIDHRLVTSGNRAFRMAISSGQRYQYAGRSLKVNGAFNWDTYTSYS